MNTAKFVLENAESQPEKVKEILISLHKKGETVEDILEFIEVLEARKIKVKSPCEKTFDVCGTGGSGKKRINLSTALAIKLSKKFCIAKHGNKAASGRVGSFDLISQQKLPIGDSPNKVATQLQKSNLSFIFAPAFHPSLKPLAPIRASIPHPTVFNYLGPILNPVENLTAQLTGVSNIEIGEKLAEVCTHLEKNICLVHDTAFGLDDVSIGGATKFWMTGIEGKTIHSGAFFPEDYGIESVKDFSDIQGGEIEENNTIFNALIDDTAPKAHQDFLKINQIVAEEFFSRF